MATFGYFLSSEEHGPLELVHQARLAEEAGFGSVWISDHYHPWTSEQGHSPFVWSVIGGIAATTELRVITAVTCPTMRIHPAVMAQAAATSQLMTGGRFCFGIGTGEQLNEHILGEKWPTAGVRLEMLEEAVEIIRQLWTGDDVTFRGKHYTVEHARLYSLPSTPPPIYISGFGPAATEVAARIGDGYMSTKPDAELVQLYESKGGKGPKQAGIKVCYGADERECVKLAHRLWRSSGIPGELNQELPTPAFFEQASELVTEDMVAESFPCGPDVDKIVGAVQPYLDAGYDEIFINQIGPHQEEFFRMVHEDLLPRLQRVPAGV